MNDNPDDLPYADETGYVPIEVLTPKQLAWNEKKKEKSYSSMSKFIRSRQVLVHESKIPKFIQKDGLQTISWEGVTYFAAKNRFKMLAAKLGKQFGLTLGQSKKKLLALVNKDLEAQQAEEDNDDQHQ